MANSETVQKVIAHREGEMLQVAQKDSKLQAILAAGGEGKTALKAIIHQLASEEPGNGAMLPDGIVITELKDRWAEREKGKAETISEGRTV